MTCVICRFGTELDDIAVGGVTGRCVCLRCYTRETRSALPMPKGLQREVVAILDELHLAS